MLLKFGFVSEGRPAAKYEVETGGGGVEFLLQHKGEF